MEEIFGSNLSRKTISSEIVKYEIFILQSEDAVAEVSEEILIECLAHATSLTKDYVWHNEGFNLALGSCDGVPCFEGSTDFGDFIEDEWIIVWLLQQITLKLCNASARIRDADGEFLLVESADFLPKWLNIDTSKNRVFIHNGSVHIVNQPSNPGQIGKLPIGQPSLQASLKSIRCHPTLTQANASINGCIEKRTAKFPRALVEYVQKVNVFIPEMIARVLDRDKSLVSAAIGAFYLRDPIDLRACRVFKEFVPSTRVWSQVSMNRCGYAQLMQQVFTADKRSGYAIPKNSGNDFKGMDLGSKIAHGFEILCSSCSASPDDTNAFDEQAFQRYLSALKARDYFCGEIEGSKRHQELMYNARSYFVKFSSENVKSDCASVSKSTSRRILELKKEILNDNFNTVSCPVREKRSELPPEDEDGWMYLDDEKLAGLLSGMQSGFEKLGKSRVKQEQEEETNLNDLSEKMQSFIKNVSDYEGVEQCGDESDVNFDPSDFENALRRLCNFGASEENGSLSDDFLSSDEDSDYDCKDDEVVGAMEQMDAELANTAVGKSFVKDCDADDNDDYKPVDIDLNLVENFLQSCESETDMPGAVTTLLQSLGLKSNG